MKNTSDMTDGKPIAVWSQSISGVNTVNPLVAFYDIHVGKEVIILSQTKHETKYKSNPTHWTHR
jgi:hypothetical protein